MNRNPQNNEAIEGEIILIDKPPSWTSFDVIKKIKHSLNIKKAGHAGTLDPLASGLLIVCTDKKTKLIPTFQEMEKEYTGSILLGEIRPSFDRETEIAETRTMEGIHHELILRTAELFHGEIEQIPPLYSAIKKNGKRAYSYARKGEEIELAPRKVMIFDFEILNIHLPEIYFRLVCSKGFYVRSLARDFGVKLGCGASLNNLRRTRIGHFSIQDALTPDQLVSLRKK